MSKEQKKKKLAWVKNLKDKNNPNDNPNNIHQYIFAFPSTGLAISTVIS